MNYAETLDYIHNINKAWTKPGLERISCLMELLGNPQKGMKFIHIGGTNGKGSTCAFLSSILVEAGYNVGLFTSPYIETYNERMQINNKNIPDDELCELVEYVRPYVDMMEDKPTEFELNTALSLLYYKKHAVDIVVFEVGLGGELDSTNVIDSPEVAVITAIGLDHTEYLGDTVEKIAETKSKIIKEGCSVVLYKQADNITQVIAERSREVGAKLYISEPDKVKAGGVSIDRQLFSYEGMGDMAMPLVGEYQLKNIAVVIKVVEALRERGWKISEGAVIRGIEKVKWPGRFEIISYDPIFIVDGAHNPHGMEAAVSSIKTLFKDEKVILIFGVMADKDYLNMLDMVLPVAKELLAVTPANPRALSAKDLAAIVNKKGVKAEAYESIEEAIDAAFVKAGHGNVICGLGSLYMIGDIKTAVATRR